MKLFHLNIEKGRKYKDLISFVKKEEPDIMCFQEMAGGEYLSGGGDLFESMVIDLDAYRGELTKQNEPEGKSGTYMGVAIFVRKGIRIFRKSVILMAPNSGKLIVSDDPMNMHCGYRVLEVVIGVGDKKVSILTGHYTWEANPYDHTYKIERAAKVVKHLRKLDHDFILTGDFNVRAETATMRQFEQVGVNLTVQKGITNTLNPNLSRHKHLFPKGIDCDHIIVSKGIIASNLLLVQKPDLSDHYGLMLEFVVQ